MLPPRVGYDRAPRRAMADNNGVPNLRRYLQALRRNLSDSGNAS